VPASTIVFARRLSADTVARPFASGLGPRSKRMTDGIEAAICFGRSSPAASVEIGRVPLSARRLWSKRRQ